MRLTKQSWIASLIGATISFCGIDARATDVEGTAGKGTLEEIVVTAQKRSEGVQDVPVSMTVLSSEELTRQGVQTLNDLARLSASLEFTAGTPGGGGFIRGIGTESVQSETATGSVSVVLDGVVLGNTTITDIFDTNRIEVLKGPQGTLFGTSVSAGVINITTNAPDPTKTYSTIDVEYGSPDLGSGFSRRQLRAVANLPVSDTSAFRLAFHSDDNSGVYFNPTTGAPSDEPDIGVRARYLWEVNDAFTVNLIADYNKDNKIGIPILTYRDAPVGSALATALGQCGVTAGPHNFDTCTQYTDRREQIDRGVSAQLDWNIGGNTLTSISSLRRGDQGTLDDITDIPLANMEQNFAPAAGPGAPGCHFYDCLPLYSILNGTPSKLEWVSDTLVSEEMRLASPQNHHFEWLVGLFYQHYSHTIDSPGTTTSQFGPGPPATSDSYYNARVHTQDYAGFANVTYYLTDVTRFIAGARYTHSTVSEAKYDPADTGTQNIYSLSVSATKPTFRLGVEQNFAKDTMAYLTFSTGYKAPEIADDLTNGNQLSGVSPELPTMVELGVKQSLLGDRLAVDADIFYERVKDFQGQICTPGTGGIVCVAQNVPRVNSKGLEIDIFGRPLPGLTLNLSGILNPATYSAGYLGEDGTDLGGKQLNYASKTKVTFSAEQSVPITAKYSFVAGADAVYRSAQSMYLSALPEYSAPAGTVVNARLGLRSSDNWSIFAFGRNIGQNAFPRLIFPVPFQTGGYWQAFDTNSLRIVGVQFQARF